MKEKTSMDTNAGAGIIEASRARFFEIVKENGLLDSAVTVSTRPLTTEEAIGHPVRRDYPLIEGRERIIEARFSGARGHAFTDSPQDFQGTLKELEARGIQVVDGPGKRVDGSDFLFCKDPDGNLIEITRH